MGLGKKAQIGWIIFGVIVLVIFLIFSVIGIHIITTQEGTHTGYVTAIEKNGIIFKTTTVYFKTDTQSSQEDAYCLIDKSLIPTLQQFQESKTQVTITFFDYLMPGWSECGNGIGIIDGVKNG